MSDRILIRYNAAKNDLKWESVLQRIGLEDLVLSAGTDQPMVKRLALDQADARDLPCYEEMDDGTLLRIV